ncbi:MAG: hypothetical protein ABI191_00315 [Rhizomicrobium sp.]
MDRRTLTTIMPTVVGIGFCVIAAVKVWAIWGAATAPDPASGRTEPAMFAAALSTDWSYITHTQIIVVGVVTGTVLLLAALMVGLQFRDRFFGDDADADADIDIVTPAPPPSSPVKPVRKGRAFGLRSGARRL